MQKLTQLVWKIIPVIAVLALFTQRGVSQVSATSQTVITSTLGNTTGVAVDPLGNLYAADGANGLLVELQGSNIAPATVLSGLSSPGEIAIDTVRNLYIADGTSNHVVKIPYQGGALNVSATTNLGTGLGTVTGVAVDLSGNVYIVDATNKQVVKLSGTTQTVLYSALTAPKQVAVDRAGNLYVTDAGANKVVYLPTGGGAASSIGTGLNAPVGVATDAANNVYIADTGNGRVLEVPYVSGAPSTTVQNVLTTSIASPTALALDSRGTVYITSGTSIYRYTAGAIYFGLLPVASTSQTFPVTLNFTAALAPTTIKVVTTGITGLDYKDAGADTCAAGNYALGNTCTVNVTFTPVGVGPRYGAIVLYDVNNKVLARVFLGGGGLGPLMTLDPGTLTTVTPTVNNVAAPFNVLTTPRGITTDAAGNIFLAEDGYTTTSSPAVVYPSRILEIPVGQTTANVIATQGNNGVAINGAGDLIVATGSGTVILYPNENGTLNTTTDVVTLGSGYSRARVAKTDVGGNIFWCDASANAVYEQQIPAAIAGTVPTKLPFTTYSTACVGVAVDLYGNIATADGTTGKALYVPATGATPYETGSGFTSAWGITFDASGSVWVSASAASVIGRIPNENGTLIGADQTLSTVGAAKDFDIWMDDSTGTLYTTQDTGNQVATFSVINRLQSTLTYATAEAIGITTAAQSVILSDSGNESPLYTNGGTVDLYDTADFIASTPASPACSFSIPLVAGFTCNLSYEFSPQSSGTRNETIEISSNAPKNGVINLTGTSSTAVSGTVTLTSALTTPSSGSPAPGQSLIITTTAKPSTTTTTAATGPLTFLIDGTPTGSASLASNIATFSIPAGLALGSHTIGVTYAGDKNYAPITAAVTFSFTVVAATSSVTLVSSGTDVAVSQSLTLTATVPTITGLKTPTGTITFKDTTTNATLGTGTLNANGIATLSTSFTTAGSNAIQAAYSGDSVYGSSTSSSITVTVGNYTTTTTTLNVTPTQPSGGYTFGTTLTTSVIVAPQSGTGTPTGSVDLLLDGSPVSVGDALNNGAVSVTLSSISAGAHVLTAYYSGDGTYSTSASANFSFSVIKASTATTLAISSTANYASVPVTLTATVSNVNVPSAAPSGNVTFYSGQASLGTVALTGNTAVLTTTLLPAGTDSITAVYQGDSNDITSTSAAMTDVVTIVPTTITLSAAPGVLTSGNTSVLTATVVGSPVTGSFSGTVTFYSGTTALSTAPISSSGVATYTTAALTAASTTYTASYSGSTVYATSTTTSSTSIYTTDANGSGVTATTLLGTGLSSAVGTAVDISGNLYITDATKGLVALVAGGAGAQTTVASGLTSPAGLATDGSGDLFIANGTAGHVTEYLSQNGALATSTAKQLGTGLGALTGVAVDPSGNVYAADATNKQVVKITASGTQTVLSSTLINPQQVAVDSLGDVYVADGTGNRVVYIPVGGTATTVGTGLVDPTGVTVDPYNNVYISDTGNNRVVKVPFTGGAPVTTSQITLIPTVTAPGQLAIDHHLALFIGHATTIYKWEADAASFGVLTPGVTSPVYTLTFTFATAITPAAINVLTNGLSGGEYSNASGSTCVAGTAYAAGQSCTLNITFTPVTAGVRPGAVTFTAATGQSLLTAYLGGVLYAPAFNFDNPTNPLNKGVSITPTSTTSGSVVGGETLSVIRGIAVDAASNVYVCDYTNSRIIQTNFTGTVGKVLYSGVSCGSIGIDGAGNVIVDDMGNSRMLLLPNENGAINGNDAYVVATGFSGPRGMGLDGFGNIYVADTTNIRVVVAPIGAAATAQYVPTFSNLKAPDDVAVDWQGNIAVADGTLAQVAYLPANGCGATVVGPPLCTPYAIAMDSGGGIYATETSENCTTGTVSPGEDVVRIVPGSTFYEEPDGHATNADGVFLDAQGNLYTAYGGNIVVQNRTSLPLAFASTVGTATAAQEVVLSNSGPAPAAFTNTTGIFYLDSLDYTLGTGTTSPCNFSNPLGGGGDCELGIIFNPVQSGTRTADFTPSANVVNQSLVVLTGTATGGTTTATTLALAVTSPANGKPLPYNPLTLTTSLSGGSGTPSGTITLSIDGVFIGQQKAAATLNFAISGGLSPGFHNAVATYSGDSTNTSSTVTLTVSAAGVTPSSTTLSVSPSTIAVLTPYNYTTCTLAGAQAYYTCTPVTLTAVVTGTAGGTVPTTNVEFFDGATLLGTSALNAAGVATLVYTGSFAQGTQSLTAEYIGNLTYAASISPVAQLMAVYPGDYTLSLTPNTVTLVAGQTASIAITATPVNNGTNAFYNGQVGLTCTGLPIYATCAVSPNTLYLDGTGTAVSGTLSIITQASFAKNSGPFGGSTVRLCMLPAASLLLLLGAGSLRRRRRFMRAVTASNLMYVLALAGLLSPLVACGSHALLAPTPGTYAVTVSGIGTGGANHSVTIQVTIQQ